MVVATGFFDGVHLGHRKVIETLVGAARERGTESVVVTFWPHPRAVLQNGAGELRLLSSLEEKKSLLLSLGVDRVETVPFTREFAGLTAEEYLREYIMGEYGAGAVVLGYDNRIGSDMLSPEQTAGIADRLGLEVYRTGSVPAGTRGRQISSSLIREALAQGKVDEASRMLGYGYTLKGVVVQGNRIGRTIGFPTANMSLYDPLKLVPSNGSYFTMVQTLGGIRYGMTNIGTRPTVTEDRIPVVETHILDFDEQIYGLDMTLTFLERIRPEIKFNSLNLLTGQLNEDRKSCYEKIMQRINRMAPQR